MCCIYIMCAIIHVSSVNYHFSVNELYCYSLKILRSPVYRKYLSLLLTQIIKCVNLLYIVSPDPVRNLKNTSSDSESITLTWEFGFNGNANISGVNVTYYARDFIIDDTQYMMISTTSLQTSLTLLNLQPQTIYVIIVRVRNSVSSEVGLSPPVNITVKTKQRETKRKVSNSGTVGS